MATTTRVVMPQLGESVHEGTISKWLVKPGDKVVEFEPMLEVDTDKVSAEVPAPVTGILKEILAKEGQTVQAGAEIAVVELAAAGEAPNRSGDGKVSATPEAPAARRSRSILVSIVVPASAVIDDCVVAGSHVPTLVIVGAQDRWVDPVAADMWAFISRGR